MGVLESILHAKREFLAELRLRALPTPPPRRRFSLRRGAGAELRLIAEIKRRSPSAGALSTVLGVAERAAAYERGGASMVSVLTDTPFFDGAYEHLALARGACSLPLLCKDFVIDELPLTSGDYELTVAISDQYVQHNFDRRDREWRLPVRHGGRIEPEGLIDLAGTWHVAAGDRAPAADT